MSTPTAKPASASLRSDAPIGSPEQDKLARGHLVEVIGKHILEADAPESVVVALNAPWGAGKSSFLNLLEQRLVPPLPAEVPLKGVDDTRPIVVRFNPWHYTNVDQLVRMFFGDLARGIGTASRRDIGKKIGELLRAAGSLAAVFSSGAGGLLKDVGGTLKEEKSLPELKRELDNLLPELAQRVVIFVDDIDRLERDALRLLFRMIRLNADFSNVTYVLAFDRLVVERNLDEDTGIRGRDYLEKIIQVSFDIPEPEPSTRYRILFSELDAVLETLKTKPLDQHRWGNMFQSGFKEHFRTIRHIKRYANGLRLTLAPVAQEVDLVDFLAIELLRVFHPEVYRGVVGGKDMLAPVRLGYRDGEPPELLKKWVEDLCAKASPGFDASVRELLRQLFPELARAYANTTYGPGHHAKWRRECRVCAPEVFDKFFLLAIPEGEVSEGEMQTFVGGLADEVASRAYLRWAKESGKARRLLERLSDFTGDIPVESAARLVAMLFEHGDELRFESRGLLDVTADMQVGCIIHQCLSRLPTSRDRFELLLECVNTGPGLYTIVQETAHSEPKQEEAEDQLLDDLGLWTQIRDATVERIRASFASGDLWAVHRLPYVIFRWLDWTCETEVRAAVAQHIADDASLLKFLSAFVGHSQSHTMGDKVGRTHARISKKELGSFLEVEQAVARVQAASRGGDAAAAALLSMLERKPRGPWDE